MSSLAASSQPFDAAVYRCFCTYAFSEAECWVSQERVAKQLGVRRETVNRSVQRMKALGWILIRKVRPAGSKWSHNHYTLLKAYAISDLAKRRIIRQAHRRKAFQLVSVRGGKTAWRYRPCGCDMCLTEKRWTAKPPPLKRMSDVERLRWMFGTQNAFTRFARKAAFPTLG